MVRGGKCPLTQIIKRLSKYNTHILISRNSFKKEIINVKFPNNFYSLSDTTTFCQVIGMVNNRYVCQVYIGESLEKLGHFELSIIGCLQADINKYKVKVFDSEILKFKGIPNFPNYKNKLIFLKLHHINI